MKILIFSPGHAIWSWGYIAGLTAEALQQRGHDVLYLTCDRDLEKACMAQAAMSVGWKATPEKKAEICALCRANANLITREMALPTAAFGTFLAAEDHRAVEEAIRLVRPDNFRKLEIDGIPVGRLSMYEFIIQNMKRSVTFEGEEWNHYRDILENACKSVYAFRGACDRFQPDVCIIEHSAYSYNRACQMVAESRQIPAYYVAENSFNIAHASELLVLAKDDPIIYTLRNAEGWEKSKDVPVSSDEARLVTDHFIALVQAKGRVFSTAKSEATSDIRKKFGIRADQKILLAMTSSYDEMFAAEVVGSFTWNTKSDIFETQTDWLKALFSFIRSRPELFLIVRIHPREFMSTKNGGISEHAEALTRELQDLPPNVAINWPTDRISIYDLAEETDVGLNAWSTAGSELSFFGIPVVVYCAHLLLYPATLNYSAKTREEYFTLIDRALEDGWKFDRIRMLYRWYATLQLRSAANISDSSPANILRRRGLFERAYFKLRRYFQPQFDQLHRVKARASKLAAGAQIERLIELGGNTFLDLTDDGRGTSGDLGAEVRDSELRTVRKELRRLYGAMYGSGKPSPKCGTLRDRLWHAMKDD